MIISRKRDNETITSRGLELKTVIVADSSVLTSESVRSRWSLPILPSSFFPTSHIFHRGCVFASRTFLQTPNNRLPILFYTRQRKGLPFFSVKTRRDKRFCRKSLIGRICTDPTRCWIIYMEHNHDVNINRSQSLVIWCIWRAGVLHWSRHGKVFHFHIYSNNEW